jgi:hypothetical protein
LFLLFHQVVIHFAIVLCDIWHHIPQIGMSLLAPLVMLEKPQFFAIFARIANVQLKLVVQAHHLGAVGC